MNSLPFFIPNATTKDRSLRVLRNYDELHVKDQRHLLRFYRSFKWRCGVVPPQERDPVLSITYKYLTTHVSAPLDVNIWKNVFESIVQIAINLWMYSRFFE